MDKVSPVYVLPHGRNLFEFQDILKKQAEKLLAGLKIPNQPSQDSLHVLKKTVEGLEAKAKIWEEEVWDWMWSSVFGDS